MLQLLRRLEHARPFTEHEAWTLFRVAALGEAVGWSLLITGIALKQFVLHGNNIPVLIAGQFHGTIFLLYVVAAISLYPSLGWSRWRAIVAGLASIPPFGSLIFEQWAAHVRHYQNFQNYRNLYAYHALLRTI